MEDKNTIHEKLREGFVREFERAQDSRTKLHASFSEQGIRLIQYRKKLIEIVITVSIAFIAAPLVFKVDPNLRLYHIGLILLILEVIFSLLHLRENIDIDEAGLVDMRNRLLPILDRRIDKIKTFLEKPFLGVTDASDYEEYRKKEDYSDEMQNMVSKNQDDLNLIPRKAIDYPSSLIMLLFISGAFFVLISVLFQNVDLFTIIFAEILIFIGTATNSAGKIVRAYASLVSFLKN